MFDGIFNQFVIIKNTYIQFFVLFFTFQYSFPPSSVGEVRRLGAPNRREIGHGMLAERALEPILPSENDFPYTIRVESTITESNGSSRFVRNNKLFFIER